jgi:tripartite-type tricarboxylate transporter receptor subunit TctC
MTSLQKIPAALLLLLSCAVLPLSASAQTYPAHVVRMIVPSAPGSTPDIVGRLLGQELSKMWKQPVVVENQAGAGGMIAMRQMLGAPADGYTVLMTPSSAASIAPAMFKLPYDVRKDLAGVSKVAYVPNVLVVNPSVPAHSIKELVDYAKANPGKLNYASAENGTPSHLEAELFKSLAHVDLFHVPYKGSPNSLIAVMQGDAQLMFCPVAIALPYIKEGKLRPLGVTTSERSEILPDVPPIGEAGVPGYSTVQWYGVFLRAGTPRPIVDRLNADVATVMHMDAVGKVLKPIGVRAVTSTPKEMDDFLRADIDKWLRVVAGTKAKVD